MAILKVRLQNNELVLIQVYAPTSSSTDNEIGNFYKLLHDTYQEIKKNKTTKIIIMGDFNSQIGKSKKFPN